MGIWIGAVEWYVGGDSNIGGVEGGRSTMAGSEGAALGSKGMIDRMALASSAGSSGAVPGGGGGGGGAAGTGTGALANGSAAFS